jgi:hypothetical protein
LTIMPIVCLSLLGIRPDAMPWLWFFSALPGIAVPSAAATTILLSLLGQWLMIAWLGFQLSRQLQKAGESETKAFYLGSVGKRTKKTF